MPTPGTHPTPPLHASPGVVVVEAPRSLTPPSWRDRLDAINDLTKPRITRLVTITSGVGYAIASVAQPTWHVPSLIVSAIGCIVGTACSASGANALNQWMERTRDGLMPRTCERPLPKQRMTPGVALRVGVAFCIVGVLVLLAACGPAAALVSLSTILVYLLAYTPLKPITTISTIVGAIPGALPPLIGWCAATSGAALWAPVSGWFVPLSLTSGAGGWSLFLLMFVWQIPHSLALAWMYKDDYAKGGYRLLPLLDPAGTRTASTVFLWSVALVPATLSPSLAMPDRLGIAYPVVATLSGLAAVWLAWKFLAERSRDRAKRVFLASIMQLPLLLIVMVIDALVIAVWQ